MTLLQISEPGKTPEPHEKENEVCIGIDFGTTNCVCSVVIDDSLIFIPDEFGNSVIPSIISFKEKKVKIGNQIFNENGYNLSELIFSIKRHFVDFPEKETYFPCYDKKISPIALSSLVFKYLKKCAESFLNKKVNKCVITVPAYFDDRSRTAIKKSAILADFDVLRLINEPTSAAYAYGLEKKTRGTYFVYDLGGGTFDVSLLKLTDGVFKVLSTGGDPKLGGDDIDESFTKYILKKNFKIDMESLNTEEKIFATKQSKTIKERFSHKDEFVEMFRVKDIKKKLTFKKDIFEKSIMDLINKTLSICEEVLSKSNININDLNGFILVGGSTKLNIIKKMIIKKFNISVFSKLDPDYVVSRGAGLHANGLVNGSDNLLLDVTPLSLGIETAGGIMEKIIERNTTVPVIKEQEFTTYEEGQTAIKIHILQGERETVKHNRTLGQFNLTGIDPKPPGIPRINVRFMVDSNGILSVSATDTSSGIQKELEVKPTYNLDINKMKEMIKESIEFASSDMEERLLLEVKMEAKRSLNELKSLKLELIEICSKKELNEIEKITKQLKIEIKGTKKQNIKDLIEKLDIATQNFSEKRIKKSIKSALVGKKYDKL